MAQRKNRAMGLETSLGGIMDKDRFLELLAPLRSAVSAQEYARQCFMSLFGGVGTTDSDDYPTQEQVNYFFFALAKKIEWELEDEGVRVKPVPPDGSGTQSNKKRRNKNIWV